VKPRRTLFSRVAHQEAKAAQFKAEDLGEAPIGDCPFDTILPRTPYLVMPKMAIQAMPMVWRQRLAALLEEAEAAGLETPGYLVLRNAAGDDPHGSALQDERTGFIKIVRAPCDPWANYRHASHDDVRKLAPNFKGGAR
jgi:hypothetical protein